MLYIREAHPVGPRQAQDNEREGLKIEDPRTLAEREQVARDFAAQFKMALPILVDSIDDRAGKAYAAMPDRIYVIDAKGNIAYKGGPGPGGFKAAEIPPVLDKLLGVSIAGSLQLPGKSDRPGSGARRPGGSGGDMRDRLEGMLSRLGVGEKDTPHVLKAVDQKMEAYHALTRARMGLMSAVRDKEDASKALAAYAEAQKKYADAIEEIDQDLDRAISYRKRTEVGAALTALGLIGNNPGQPMSGVSAGGMPLGRSGRPFER